MADVIPLVIGLSNLTEDQMWTMTPAEIFARLNALSEQKLKDLRFFDLWNARHYTLYASAHGIEDAKVSDYLLFPAEPEKKSAVPVMGDSPEVIGEKLKLLTTTMGGKVDA